MARGRTRSTWLEARLSPETLALVRRAAEIDVLRLALADQRALADALAAPPRPVSALRRARAAHRRLIAAPK
jgi:uncharacterized protein (DUF1778 family)